jgi:hypothetical protein
MNSTKKMLLSFVGTNDAGKLINKSDGALLTVFKERNFDEVHLLWNTTKNKDSDFLKIAEHVRREITNRGYCKTVKLHQFDCNDVTDHNEIYPKLISFCKLFPTSKDRKYTAAISSGTPAMQACWILLAESGDYPLELIRCREPKYGKPYVSVVKLGTALPKIIRLQEEKEELLRQKNEILPKLVIHLSNGKVQIGNTLIPLSPIEFSYYRYFIERCIQGLEPQRFSGISVPNDFLKKIIQFHKETFPDSDLFRLELENMLRQGRLLSIGTFRSNVTKSNIRIRKSLNNPALSKIFEINRQGKRHAVVYSIQVPPSKIIIKKEH